MSIGTSAAEQQSAGMRAPTSARGLQQVTGTGATSNATTTTLRVGEMAAARDGDTLGGTVLVGATAIRIGFASTEAAAETAASATAPILPAYGRLDWLVTASDAFVAAEAVDGASAFEFSVWTSSGV